MTAEYDESYEALNEVERAFVDAVKDDFVRDMDEIILTEYYEGKRTQAVKALEDAIDAIYYLDGHRRSPEPGGFLKHLSEETRRKLKELTSDDIKNVRPDSIFGVDIERKEM